MTDVPTARTAAVALIVTLAIQVFTSFAGTAAAVLAPEIAADFAISPRLIGVFVGLLYVGSSLASLLCGGFIARYGAIRVSQACVLLCAAGLAAVALLPPGWALLLLAAPLLIGIGYGPITPASSQVLARTTPATRMGLVFSVKQTGVPVGTALAGALLPLLALAFGWRAAFFYAAAAGAAIALLAQPTRARLDADREADHRFSLAAIGNLLRLVLRRPALAELALLGLIYAAAQLCLLSFLVVYLTESLGISLVTAGLALSAVSLGGIAGRIAWGTVADRWLSPRVMLGLLGCVAGACAWLTTGFSNGWHPLALYAVCTLYGATALGWNGVQLAEVARHAPPGQAGAVTGTVGFLMFSGVVIGPPLFAGLAALTGSYRAGFAVFGTLSLACGLWLLLGRRRHAAPLT
jgi:predicted MFS family arabinose efflux permease